MANPSTALWEKAGEVACAAAIEAWRTVIQPIYERKEFQIEHKADESPTTDADREADRFIVDWLSQRFPPDLYGYLSEESEDNAERLTRSRVWIIDPIDGTRDFIKGTGNFAIHVGLAEQMQDGKWRPVAGAVYRPVAGHMYSAVLGRGAWRRSVGVDGKMSAHSPERLSVSRRDRIEQMRSVVSNTPSTGRLMRLITSLGLQDYWQIGSLGIKLCAIAEGGAELYVNVAKGKSKEWDSCAPEVILTEAGGVLTDLDGHPIFYNQTDVSHLRGLVASNGIIHGDLLDLVANFLSQDQLRQTGRSTPNM